MVDIINLPDAKKRIKELERELVHWQANHADVVGRCALLSQRDDLPVDRLPAFKELERLQAENAQLRLDQDELPLARRWRAAAADACDEAGLVPGGRHPSQLLEKLIAYHVNRALEDSKQERLELESALELSQAMRTRMATILRDLSIVLKGPVVGERGHDWTDLAEVAARIGIRRIA